MRATVYINIIFLQASSPASPILIMKEIFTKTMLNVIKDFNTKELIDYLKRKNLKLNKDNIKILHKEKIASSDFARYPSELVKYIEEYNLFFHKLVYHIYYKKHVSISEKISPVSFI